MALPDFSYIVVIVERRSFWLLLTTHCVEFSSRRKKLAKEYDEATEKG